MKKFYIAPSILSADFSSLLEEIKSVEENGATYLHFDVMDGHFVKNISFGACVLKSIASKTSLIKDVHLMIENVDKYYLDFVKAGADIITFHYEALKKEDILPLIKEIKSNNVKVGLSIKPKTRVSSIKKFLPFLDLVLVMSVEPGFGGQSFLDNSLNKISLLNKLKKENKYNYLIEVDGGINEETAKKVRRRGVDILVSGSYIFKSSNKKEVISKLKGEKC